MCLPALTYRTRKSQHPHAVNEQLGLKGQGKSVCPAQSSGQVKIDNVAESYVGSVCAQRSIPMS